MIRDVANVATSFPGFVALARSVGLDIRESAGLRRMPWIQVPVMTIDGPSGSGKGTVSRAVARALGWALLDSGALYRLVALAGRQAALRLDDGPGLARLAETADIQLRFGPVRRGNRLAGRRDVTGDSDRRGGK